jgi:hypothetical protein
MCRSMGSAQEVAERGAIQRGCSWCARSSRGWREDKLICFESGGLRVAMFATDDE